MGLKGNTAPGSPCAFFSRFHLRSCTPCNNYQNSMDKGLEHILHLKAIHYPCDETEDTMTAPPTHLMLKSPALQSFTLQSNGQLTLTADCEETGYKQNFYKLTINFIKSLEKQFILQAYDFKFFRKNRAQVKFIEFFLFSQMGAPGSQPDRCLLLCKSGHSHLWCFTSHRTLQETPALTLLPETRVNCYLPSKLS